jgi:hypothetical protein
MSDLEIDKLSINQLGFVGQEYLSKAATKSLLTPAAEAGGGGGGGGSLDFTTAGSHILFQCDSWDDGSVEIPESKLGKYMMYEIKGTIGYWAYYCSALTFASAGACGGACEDTFKAYCCVHTVCNWYGDGKCFNGSESQACGGQVTAPFGCSSGCLSACSLNGWNYHIGYYPMAPNGPHDSVGKIAQYCAATSHGPGGSEMCCIGVRSSGRLCMCCGGDASCLTGLCFSTPSGGSAIACCSTVTVIGHGKIDVS